jgi:hypothetical protein
MTKYKSHCKRQGLIGDRWLLYRSGGKTQSTADSMVNGGTSPLAALAQSRSMLWAMRLGGEELNGWLGRWSAEVADLRIHGTTHERPIDRFASEQLTPLGSRPPYRYERVRLRRVANDALVAVSAARYSVSVEYVGQIVSVHTRAPTIRDLPPGSARRMPSEGRAS